MRDSDFIETGSFM